MLVLALVFTAGYGGAAGAAPETILGPQLGLEKAAPEFRYVVDARASYTPEEARRYIERAGPGARGTLSLGVLNKPVWIELTLTNAARQGRSFALDFVNPRLGTVELYELGPEGAIPSAPRTMGLIHDSGLREYSYPAPAFRLRLRGGESKTILARVMHRGSMRFGVHLWTQRGFEGHVFSYLLRTLLLEGGLLALAGYSLCLYIGLREKAYLWHFALVMLFTLYAMSLSGTAAMAVWPGLYWWSDHAPTVLGMCMLIASLAFAASFLNAREYAPRLHWVSVWLAGMAAITAALGLTNFPVKYIFSYTLGLTIPLMVFAICIQGMRRGYRAAYIFFLTWFMVLCGAVLLLFINMGWAPYSQLTDYVLHLFFLFASVLWTFALTDRIKTQEKQNRAELEEAVERRTLELRSALEQVKTLRGLVPICSHCKKVRDDQGYWYEVERYVGAHTEADFSHSMCPACLESLYPDFYSDKQGGGESSKDTSVS